MIFAVVNKAGLNRVGLLLECFQDHHNASVHLMLGYIQVHYIRIILFYKHYEKLIVIIGLLTVLYGTPEVNMIVYIGFLYMSDRKRNQASVCPLA